LRSAGGKTNGIDLGPADLRGFLKDDLRHALVGQRVLHLSQELSSIGSQRRRATLLEFLRENVLDRRLPARSIGRASDRERGARNRRFRQRTRPAADHAVLPTDDLGPFLAPDHLAALGGMQQLQQPKPHLDGATLDLSDRLVASLGGRRRTARSIAQACT
jgi:hypothetical protein